MKKEWFYSKSKEDWKKHLSNFTAYDENGLYPSVEAQFQAMKFCYSDNPGHRLLIDWKKLSPAECRSYGSKSYFKKHHITLDVEAWERDKVEVMKELLLIRMKKDDLFRDILHRARQNNIQFIHFSVRDRFWGAFQRKDTGEMVGKNMLGKLLHEIVLHS